MNRLAVACLVLASACRTTTTSSPPNMASAVVTHAAAAQAWRMVDAGRVLGYVVRFEAAASSASAYFSVRNEHWQEIGIVGADGRAWRYRAHASEPEWLGSGTVLQGARGILETPDAGELEPIALTR